MKDKHPGSPGGSGDEGLDTLLNAMRGVYAQQARENPTAVRSPERTIDDVTWNAVVMGHPNRFEDMPEVFSVAQTVASKLRAMNAIPAKADPYSPVVLSGLLNFLWRSQNLAYLAPEMAQGQAGALMVAARVIASQWAPPTGKAWFTKLAEFPVAVDGALKRIDAVDYDNVYKHLDKEMQKLRSLAMETLTYTKQKHPDATPAAMGWLMGTIIQKNTFSPLDGSVPEDIGERLTGIYNALESEAEAAFFPWLSEGFTSVREKPTDELQRWKLK